MMKYENPIIRGMYPDPSVCRGKDKYVCVCSSMNYFPGVPLFESDDCVNWKQIGHCLTRESQVDLTGGEIWNGIFAPTIRYHEGRYYMVTTNAIGHDNFYVYTDDLYGEWSESIFVKQEGIDPTLYFEDGRAYFISNGGDEQGSCIIMSEIDITTGELLTEPKCLWRGTGGRFMEAPHLYHIGEYYYVLDAEGGTEYGHMVCYGRSKNMWGPFENYSGNPVLTNRNLGGYILQGAGHGDLIEGFDGNWWFIHLAFRQAGQWSAYHHLGREVCLVPVEWKDGWFTMGNGTSQLSYDLPERSAKEQKRAYHKTIASLTEDQEWCYLRKCQKENYSIDTAANTLTIQGKPDSIMEVGFPSFIGVRMWEFDEKINAEISAESGCQEAGITLFMDEHHHYDLFLQEGKQVVLRYTIGCVSREMEILPVEGNTAKLQIVAEPSKFSFYANDKALGMADTKYLSTEVAGGFTGAVTGFYVVDTMGRSAEFRSISIKHEV